MSVQSKPGYKGCVAGYKKTELLASIKGMKTTAKIMVYNLSSQDRPIYFLDKRAGSAAGLREWV